MTFKDPVALEQSSRGKSGPPGSAPRVLFVGLWTLAVIGIAGTCFLPAERSVRAFPLDVRSGVRISLPGGQGSLPLTFGKSISAGSRLTIPNGGSVALRLLPGIAAQTEGRAEFSLEELTMRKHGVIVEGRHALLAVHTGRVRCFVTMPADRQADLGVLTPAGTVECAPGTAVSVSVSSEGLRVVCGWGAVRWQARGSSGAATLLLAGEFCDRTTEAVSKALPRRVTEDAGSQEEMAELLRIGTVVASLEADRRARSAIFCVCGLIAREK